MFSACLSLSRGKCCRRRELKARQTEKAATENDASMRKRVITDRVAACSRSSRAKATAKLLVRALSFKAPPPHPPSLSLKPPPLLHLTALVLPPPAA